jgi:hypothetical protein
MTAALGTGVRADLLYLVIDMRDNPTFKDFAYQVGFLNSVVGYCVGNDHTPELPDTLGEDMTVPVPHMGPTRGSRSTELHIVRTSMASPWVTVLSDIAKTSTPAAYGVSALVALHKLMNMVMDWQNHRQSLAERRRALNAEDVLVTFEAQQMGAHSGIAGNRARASHAISRINRVAAAEMIDPDDPRAH